MRGILEINNKPLSNTDCTQKPSTCGLSQELVVVVCNESVEVIGWSDWSGHRSHWCESDSSLPLNRLVWLTSTTAVSWEPLESRIQRLICMCTNVYTQTIHHTVWIMSLVWESVWELQNKSKENYIRGKLCPKILILLQTGHFDLFSTMVVKIQKFCFFLNFNGFCFMISYKFIFKNWQWNECKQLQHNFEWILGRSLLVCRTVSVKSGAWLMIESVWRSYAGWVFWGLCNSG